MFQFYLVYTNFPAGCNGFLAGFVKFVLPTYFLRKFT